MQDPSPPPSNAAEDFAAHLTALIRRAREEWNTSAVEVLGTMQAVIMFEVLGEWGVDFRQVEESIEEAEDMEDFEDDEDEEDEPWQS